MLATINLWDVNAGKPASTVDWMDLGGEDDANGGWTFGQAHVNGIGPVAFVHYWSSGVTFTTIDWQSTQPASVDEIADHQWIDRRGRPAIMLNGLPAILE